MYPPKKSPYPWEMQTGGPQVPIGMQTGGPNYVGPVGMQTGGPQNIDPGGLALPRPNQRQYTQEEQDWLRNNPGDEHRMAEALNNTPGGGNQPPAYTNPSNPPPGDSTQTPGPPPNSGPLPTPGGITYNRNGNDINSPLPPTDYGGDDPNEISPFLKWVMENKNYNPYGSGKFRYNLSAAENERIEREHEGWSERNQQDYSGQTTGNPWLDHVMQTSGYNDIGTGWQKGWGGRAGYVSRNMGATAPQGWVNPNQPILPPPGDSTQTPGPPPLTLPPPGGTIPGQQIPPIGDSTGTPGPPAYTNPSMNPGIQAPVIRPGLPKSPSMSAGNMSSPPPPGENKFASSRKRIPNYVGK